MPVIRTPISLSQCSSPTVSRSALIASGLPRGAPCICASTISNDPAPIPRDTDYSSVFESDVPIIVQHTRLDSRHAEVSLLSTTAYAEA